MAAIVKIRDENGNIIEIPAFRGPRGLTGETGPQGPKGDPGDATINDTATSSTSVWSSQKVVDYLNENYQPEIPVDDTLSDTSENPVQNKVINAALAGKSDTGHIHAAEDITSGKLNAARLPTSGVTAGSYGPTGAVTSGSFNVPQVTVDTYGRVTSVTNRSVTLPSTVSSITADKVAAGTLGGKVQANATAAATLGNAQVRDIIVSTTDLTAGSSTLATGTVYLVYE